MDQCGLRMDSSVDADKGAVQRYGVVFNITGDGLT
jgi:hypothetical protein